MKEHVWQTPKNLLIVMTIAMTLAFATWMALLNNFVVERAAFTGKEIGILQSIREIPGFLAFTTVFVLLLIREQIFAYISLAVLGIGVALSGYFPSEAGLYLTTFVMSVGFHYYETVKQSLSLQWLSIDEAPAVLGKLIAVSSVASLVVYSFLWLGQGYLSLSYETIYFVAGGSCLILTLFMWLGFPTFTSVIPQRKHLLLRKRYWLYYALTFMGGARRQIFMVFAGFLMVEKFGYSVSDIAALFMINHLFNWAFASRIAVCFVYSRRTHLLIVLLGPVRCMWLIICSFPWRLLSRLISKKSLIQRIWHPLQVLPLPSIISPRCLFQCCSGWYG